jgi:hypothetical protein
LSSTRARDHRLYLFLILRWAKASGVNLHGLDHPEHFAQRMHPDARTKAPMNAEGI